MNVLGIDYGRRFVGIAFSQGEAASGLMTVPTAAAVDTIGKLCQEHKVKKLVIGLPEGFLKQETSVFGARLGTSLGLPIEFWDETLTSFQAQQTLQKSGQKIKTRKQKEHAIAAALILDSYIEAHEL